MLIESVTERFEDYVEGISDYSLVFRDAENSNGVYMDPINEVYDKCLSESHQVPAHKLSHKQSSYLEHCGGGDPGYGCGVGCCEEGPAPGACLALDGGNGGDTGEVEQYKYKVCVGCQWCDAFL